MSITFSALVSVMVEGSERDTWIQVVKGALWLGVPRCLDGIAV